MKSSHAKGLICIVCLPITWLHVCSSEKFTRIDTKRVTVLEKNLPHVFICFYYVSVLHTDLPSLHVQSPIMW
uniref:Putative secreted protein n=1 Tax=Rhipicephalus microplus TaxID=6941 RepID=A0A6G5A0K8_RHIMP